MTPEQSQSESGSDFDISRPYFKNKSKKEKSSKSQGRFHPKDCYEAEQDYMDAQNISTRGSLDAQKTSTRVSLDAQKTSTRGSNGPECVSLVDSDDDILPVLDFLPTRLPSSEKVTRY